MDFAMMLLEKGNVAVSPGSGFGPAGEGYLRMSLVENENRLRQAVRQIGRCLNRESKLKGYGGKGESRGVEVDSTANRNSRPSSSASVRVAVIRNCRPVLSGSLRS